MTIGSPGSTMAACRDDARCAETTLSEAIAKDRLKLLERVGELEAAVERLERENLHLASMFVASSSFRATLEFEQLLQSVKQTLINLIGSEQFGIYLVSEDGREFALVAHEGLEHGNTLLRREGAIGRAMDERTSIFPNEAARKSGAPLACIPLTTQDTELGVIVVYGLLDHKEGLLPGDRELIDLIAREGASALYMARFFAEHRASADAQERPRPTQATSLIR